MSTENVQAGAPPQVTLYQLATGHYLSHALYLAAKLGIADLLKDGPRHSKQLAEITATHAHSLKSRGAAANDVNMLVNTGGRQRSEAEFRALYDATGFRLLRIVPTQAGVSVIEGLRA